MFHVYFWVFRVSSVMALFMQTKCRNSEDLSPPSFANILVIPTTPFLVGQMVNAQCLMGQHSPLGQVVWRIGDTVLSQGIDRVTHGRVIRSSLTFVAEKAHNGQNITCTPKIQQWEYKSLRGNFTMEVLYPPAVNSIVPSSETPLEGSDVYLNCAASEGNPSNIDWQWEYIPWYTCNTCKEGPLGVRSQTDAAHLMYVFVASWRYSGTYVCKASNDAGSSEARTTVYVKYKPIDLTPLEDKTVTGVLFNNIIVQLVVQSYPPITKSSLHVSFKQSSIIDYNVEKNVVIGAEPDIYYVMIGFYTLIHTEVGKYTVKVDNGAGEIEIAFIVNLNKTDNVSEKLVAKSDEEMEDVDDRSQENSFGDFEDQQQQATQVSISLVLAALAFVIGVTLLLVIGYYTSKTHPSNFIEQQSKLIRPEANKSKSNQSFKKTRSASPAAASSNKKKSKSQHSPRGTKQVGFQNVPSRTSPSVTTQSAYDDDSDENEMVRVMSVVTPAIAADSGSSNDSFSVYM